ncbi:hypothetical protein E2C01_080809 [Portunus trituberculatus]|uniref:Uncharacterized protein n=1 Tax=Portunus trituberculatus TaxID=210409 RepID=A0A5B7IX22_PORTR|nr:hypothetical protein [Portunus trituberculatus]
MFQPLCGRASGVFVVQSCARVSSCHQSLLITYWSSFISLAVNTLPRKEGVVRQEAAYGVKALRCPPQGWPTYGRAWAVPRLPRTTRTPALTTLPSAMYLVEIIYRDI